MFKKEKWKHSQQESVGVTHKITHTQKSHSLTVIKEQAKQQLSSSTKCAIQTKKKKQCQF